MPKTTKVTVVTIMFGNRWKFLSQVIAATMKDPYITKFVIVDNGSENEKEIQDGTKQYGDRVIILRQEKNLGSAGGFATGISYARNTDCDFVLLLDDDCILEDGGIKSFLEIHKLFRDQKVVLSGSRHNVLTNKEYFYKQTISDDSIKGTFFEVFSFKKIVNFFELLFFRGSAKNKRGPFIPIIPTEAFVYGGTFLPIEAVQNAPLPDASLFLYGDDIEYSWNIKKLGYSTYLCSSPRIFDIDFTFNVNNSHIFGQFDPLTSPFRVYFRMRNMVRLSVRHSSQGKVALFFNVFFWTLGLLILGLTKKGPTPFYFKRSGLIVKAVLGGYFVDRPIPKEAIPA